MKKDLKTFGELYLRSKDAHQDKLPSLSLNKAQDMREKNKEMFHYSKSDSLKEEQKQFEIFCYMEKLN